MTATADGEGPREAGCGGWVAGKKKFGSSNIRPVQFSARAWLSDLPPFCLSGVGSCRLAAYMVGGGGGRQRLLGLSDWRRRQHVPYLRRRRALEQRIQPLADAGVAQRLERPHRRPPEHAQVVEQQAVVGFVLLQQPVAVQQARLVVEKDEQRGVGLAGEVVRRRRHDVRVPLEVVQVVDDPVQVGDQVVEHDQIGPLGQLDQPLEHLGRGRLRGERTRARRWRGRSGRWAVSGRAESVEQQPSHAIPRPVESFGDVAHVESVQMSLERPER
uniref:Uncharacterized protein n=1 Tax=Anopheles merus TaxID=30066 RepID=A0A182UQ26_ANOME